MKKVKSDSLSRQAREWITDNQDSLNRVISGIRKSSVEPSQLEITAEVDKQKAAGRFVEITSEGGESNVRNIGTKKAIEYDGREKSPDQKLIAGLFFYGIIVLCITTLLVNASLDVFSNSWSGYLKAILLEIGILTLAAMTPTVRWAWSWECFKDLGSWMLSRGTLVALLGLSFSVLHTGVETKRSTSLTGVTSADESLISLKKERNDYQNIHDSLGKEYATKKQILLKKISGLNVQISGKTSEISKSPVATIIELKNDDEMKIRAVLLLMNIIFGHKLWNLLSKLECPSIRGSNGNFANNFH